MSSSVSWVPCGKVARRQLRGRRRSQNQSHRARDVTQQLDRGQNDFFRRHIFHRWQNRLGKRFDLRQFLQGGDRGRLKGFGHFGWRDGRDVGFAHGMKSLYGFN